MRGLPLRPDDRELFQNIADAEKTAFLQSHTDAFKRMWTEEGEVYWLRFLLAFKRNFETSIMVQPEYQFIFEEDEDEKLVSFVFISIHNLFVHCTYSEVHTFVGNVFIAIKHLHNLTEPSKVTNPFYTKESREAFRAILGQPDQHGDFAPALIAFALSIYGMFIGAVAVLLKRWLKETDLSEKSKKGIDYTYFYWKPPPDWLDEYFWASCFEKHLSDTYKDELPKLLLTANIQNIFRENHDMDCLCRHQTEKGHGFEMFKSSSDDSDSDYCIQHKGVLKPYVKACAVHSNCYLKILHSSKCPEPYLCEGSEHCKISCEKTIKSSCSKNNSSSFWQKVLVETFSCKQPNMRHASTLAQSNNTQIETFVHETLLPEKIEIMCKRHDEETEFMMELMHDPEMMNTFNQHKRKEEYKNKLRTKFRQKYCSSAKDFEDPSYCMNLFESAQKLWIMGVFEENFSKLKSGMNSIDKTNLFDSRECAENTVATGTSCVLTGRIVTPLVQNACHSASASEASEMHKSIPDSTVTNEVKTKKKRKQKKKKHKLNGGDEKKSVEKKTESVDEPKELSAGVTEKMEVILIKEEPADSVIEEKKHKIAKMVIIPSNEKNSSNIEKEERTEPNNVLECDCLEGNMDKEIDRLLLDICSCDECSSNGRSFSVLCKKKELSSQNDTLPNNSTVVTENPKVNLKKRKIVEISNDESSLNLKEKATVNHNILQQLFNPTSSCETAQKSCVKIAENCVVNPDMNASNSVVLDKNEAINGLTFESEEEKTVEDFLTLIGVISKPSKDEPVPNCAGSDTNQKGDTLPLDRKLKVCAFCSKKEVTYKTFKRCAKCKAENFPEQLYYCSRQCQVDDWQESHRDEHLKRSKK